MNSTLDFRQVIGRGHIYFLRHGESAGNVARVPQGRADFPLTEAGERQAILAAQWFEDQEIDLILSSPLQRASQTAELLADRMNIGPVQICEVLNEIEIGIFTGLQWESIRTRFPKAWRQFHSQSWDGVPGAEKSQDILNRAEKAWKLILSHFQNGKPRILVVTHSGLLQWIIKATVGSRDWFPLFPMHNCSIYQFSIHNRVLPPDEISKQETPAFYFTWRFIDLEL